MARLSWALAACLALALCVAGPAHALSHDQNGAADLARGRKDLGTRAAGRQLHELTPLTCSSPLTKCGNDPYAKCVDLQNDVNNCGTCAKKCPAGATCLAGVCTCYDVTCNDTPFSICGTFPYWACRDLLTDESNCGACGRVCPARSVCVKGTTCRCIDRSSYDNTTPFNLCGSAPYWSCQDLLTDENNCGTCGKKCPAGATCINGDCVCPADQTRCGSSPYWTCKSLQTDEDNCGVCGRKCPAGATCNAGNCECDSVNGKEISLCGSSPYWTCKSLTDDEDNCGTCGKKCPAGATCLNGDCV
jgi:hypothetical protein